jgi:hypothetical protein
MQPSIFVIWAGCIFLKNTQKKKSTNALELRCDAMGKETRISMDAVGTVCIAIHTCSIISKSTR